MEVFVRNNDMNYSCSPDITALAFEIIGCLTVFSRIVMGIGGLVSQVLKEWEKCFWLSCLELFEAYPCLGGLVGVSLFV